MGMTVQITTVPALTNPVTREKLENLVKNAQGQVVGAAETGDIANGAVTEAKLGNASVATAKIADGAVTAAKLTGSEAGVMLCRNAVCVTKVDKQQVLTASGWQDVTGLTTTVTLRDANSKVLLLASVVMGANRGGLRLVRNGEPLLMGNVEGLRTPVQSGIFTYENTAPMMLIDAPGAVGPHVYKVQALSTFSNGNINAAVDADTNYATNIRGASSLCVIELFVLA